jgi:hypothetical protein
MMTGCAACHTPSFTTGTIASGSATIPSAALSNQMVNLFSDLLVHHCCLIRPQETEVEGFFWWLSSRPNNKDHSNQNHNFSTYPSIAALLTVNGGHAFDPAFTTFINFSIAALAGF